ncbi:MAG: UvrD-helicase domain-containing protein [Phycisphaerales bacterium JB037]
MSDRLDNRVILASAGTGKTYQLTTRYLTLLALGVPPERILASTFTRKAAGEILQRILAELADASLSDAAAQALDERLNRPVGREGVSRLLERVLRSGHRSGVSTLDAFFGKVARGAAWELGIGSGWRIVDDLEDERLRAEALDDAIEEMGGEGVDDLADLVTRLRGPGHARSVQETMLRAINQAHAAFLATGGAGHAWARLREELGPARTPEDIDRVVEQSAADLRVATLPLTKNGTPNKNFVKAREATLGALTLRDWDRLCTAGLGKAMLTEERTYYGIPLPEGVQSSLEPVMGIARHEIIARFAHRNEATHELVSRFDAAYRRRLREEHALAFEDVTRSLAEADLRGDLAEIYYRLDGRYDHALLDEFQDTSIQQFELLDPILDEMISDPEGRRSVFVVGDVKQSLYAWRQAEPAILPSLPERWSTLTVEPMDRSWRSSPTVLDAVNRVFGAVADGSAPVSDGVRATWRAWFKQHEAQHADRLGHVTLREAPESSRESSQGPMALAAERIARVRATHPAATCAVLVRTNKSIPVAVRWLKHAGLTVSREGGTPLTDCPAVATVLAAVWAADHPGDSVAALHAAQSPLGRALGSAVDAQQPFDPSSYHGTRRRAGDALRARIARDGLGATVAHLRDSVLPALDAAAAHRLSRLERLACEADADLRMTPGAFVEMVARYRETDEDPSAVRVMTIHASKGLEFDAVALPDLHWDLGLSSGSVLMDRPSYREPVDAVTIYPSELLRVLSPMLRSVFERCDEREVTQSLCVLYVAMTRAGRSLDLILPPRTRAQEKDDTGRRIYASDIVRAGLEAGDDAGVLFESGTEAWAGDEAGDRRGESSIATPKTITLSLARRERAPTHRLERSAPSGAGHPQRAAELFTAVGSGARSRGSALHAMFEEVGWLDEGMPGEAELLARARAEGLEADAALAALFRGWLEGAQIGAQLRRTAFERSDATLRLERELPFAARAADGLGRTALVSGRFDRVVLAERGGRVVEAWVLDLKSDSVEADEAEHAAEGYGAQMRSYRAAACAMFGLEPDRVHTRLLFGACDRVVEVGP